MTDKLRDAVHRRVSLAQTLKAVAWSFFGVRNSADNERDLTRLNPVHLVIAGLLGAALFIAALLSLVGWVLASGVAT